MVCLNLPASSSWPAIVIQIRKMLTITLWLTWSVKHQWCWITACKDSGAVGLSCFREKITWWKSTSSHQNGSIIASKKARIHGNTRWGVITKVLFLEKCLREKNPAIPWSCRGIGKRFKDWNSKWRNIEQRRRLRTPCHLSGLYVTWFTV